MEVASIAVDGAPGGRTFGNEGGGEFGSTGAIAVGVAVGAVVVAVAVEAGDPGPVGAVVPVFFFAIGPTFQPHLLQNLHNT